MTMTIEDQIAEWFPYAGYRPHQQDMLRAVYGAVAEGKTLLINAPTGSGKSSNIAAVLAATHVRPIIVAVRTVSQLDIFVRELEMIRQNKKPNLKFSYIVGKGKVCRVYGEIGVNEKCKYLKKASKSRIEDHVVQADLSGKAVAFDAAAPSHCPWFVKSKEYDDDAGAIADSPALREKADVFRSTMVNPDDVKTFAGDLCPYEMMRRAAYDSDVVIVNYQHVLNPSIRTALLGRFYKGDDLPVLICDEAHNLGASLEELHSIQIDRRNIEKASEEHERQGVRESLGEKYNSEDSDLLPSFFEWVAEFIKVHDDEIKKEDLFRADALWKRMQAKLACGEGPVSFLDDVYHQLMAYQKKLEDRADESSVKENGCSNLIKVVGFLLMFASSMEVGDEKKEDLSIVKIFVKNDRGSALKLRNIDPSTDAQELMACHKSMILMSGTLHPPEVYGKYLFGVEAADKLVHLSLPNVFPEENRKLVVCVDVTSTYKAVNEKKGDNDNNMHIFQYLNEFVRLPGNLAIYFPSYTMLMDYDWKLKMGKNGMKRKFFVEPRNARDAARILDEYIGLPLRGESGVLLAVSGGKFSEGIDYRGETMVGVMVVGLPLAAYSSVMRHIIKYYEKKLGSIGNFIAYTLPALNRANQALGRCIRSENEKGFMVLLDRRYLENARSLPGWMKDEMERVVVEEFGDIVSDWVGRDV